MAEARSGTFFCVAGPSPLGQSLRPPSSCKAFLQPPSGLSLTCSGSEMVQAVEQDSRKQALEPQKGPELPPLLEPTVFSSQSFRVQGIRV